MRLCILLAFLALAGLAAPALAATTPEEAEDPITQAGIELERGNYAAAADLLTEVLGDASVPPDRRASVHNDRGIAHWRLGKLKEALTDFNEAAKLLPELAAIYNNRGNVLLAMNEAEEAIRDFDRAILLAPSYVAAFNNRAIAHMQIGDHEAAVADFAKAARLAPTAPAPVSGRGRAELAMGHPYLAIRSFARSIALDPSFKAGYRNRAEVLVSLERSDEAVEDLSSALGFAPDDPQLLLARGKAYLAIKAYGPAIQDFSRAIELDPRTAANYVERGRAYAIVREYERALEDFGIALDLDKRSASAFAARAAAHSAMLAPELGLADVERALKLDQQNAEAYRVRAAIEEQLGQSSAAVADYKQAVTIAPDDAIAWAALERLGGPGRPQAVAVAGTELDDWTVYSESSGRYFALSSKLKKLSVPLEVFGGEAPRLIEFEPKAGAFKGVGVLRYRAGRIATEKGAEEIEYAAIIDLHERRLVGLEPYRQGSEMANWTWDEETGAVTVRGPDGIQSEHKLRGGRPKFDPDAQGDAVAGQGQSFDDFWFGTSPRNTTGQQRERRQVVTQKRRQKPKTLFDLLFQ